MKLDPDILAALPFITPAIFWAGMAATSVPIIIHLLNKRRFRVVIWAAMDFLLAAQRRNARKLKFQRWLLLALRILALIVLAMAIAQFTLSSQVMGNLLGGSKVAVIILDDSYSMALAKPGGTSAFERSRKLAVDYLATMKTGDKVLVIRTSEAASAASAKLNPDPRSLIPPLQAAEPSDAGTDLATALNAAAAAIKGDADFSRNRQVLVLTDLSASSLPADDAKARAGAEASPGREQLKQAAEKVKAVASLRVIDMGIDDQANVAVTELKPVRPIMVAGMMADFSVTVLNATDRPQIDLPLTLYVDSQIVSTARLARIDPGQARTVPISHTFATPGKHAVEVRMPNSIDFLPVDDGRRLVVNVQRDIPMLLVDGAPGDNHTLGSTTYLWLGYSLSSEEKTASAFAPRIVPELQFATLPLTDVKVLALSDTEVPAPAIAKRIKDFVEDGGLLMVFPGKHTRAEQWNNTMGEGGAKLLPATFGQLEEIKSMTEIGEGLQFAPNYAHAVLAKFEEASKSGLQVGLTTAQTQQYLQLGVPKDAGVDVILRFTKKGGGAGEGHPAVVAKQVGRGHVVQFATTGDTSWTSFPAKPSFVPFMHELAYYLLTGESDQYTLGLGQRINLPVDAAAPLAGTGWWTAPRKTKVSVTLDKEKEKDNRLRLVSGPLTLAGFYAPEGGKPLVGVNVDAAEADVRHIAPAQMAAALAINAGDIIRQPSSLAATRAVAAEMQQDGAGSIGRNLLVLALLLFMTETVLARLFSVYR